MVYINECIDVNTALKNSFKSMSYLCRIKQFPRNFLSWQAPGCIKIYSFKSMFSNYSVVVFTKLLTIILRLLHWVRMAWLQIINFKKSS